MKIIFKILRKLQYLYYDLKGYIIKKQFLKHGKNIKFWGHVIVKNPENILIGNKIDINDNVYLNGAGGITIGNKVVLSASSMLISTGLDTTVFLDKMKHNNQEINIGNNVQVGAGAIILAGVKIGDNVIIGAGSVVTSNIESNSVAVGVPCKILRKIYIKE